MNLKIRKVSIAISVLLMLMLTIVASAESFVTMSEYQGYDFSTGKYIEVGGDVYFGQNNNIPTFWANNVGMNGLKDVGIYSDLNNVPIPSSGFNRFGVPAISGHTYVTKAEDGEEGYIIFTVNFVDQNRVDISYKMTTITESSNNIGSNSNAGSSSGNKIVELRGNGFKPFQLTVYEGTTITWVNKDSYPMNINVDYIERGPNGGGVGTKITSYLLSSGSSFSYTLGRTGEYQVKSLNIDNTAQNVFSQIFVVSRGNDVKAPVDQPTPVPASSSSGSSSSNELNSFDNIQVDHTIQLCDVNSDNVRAATGEGLKKNCGKTTFTLDDHPLDMLPSGGNSGKVSDGEMVYADIITSGSMSVLPWRTQPVTIKWYDGSDNRLMYTGNQEVNNIDNHAGSYIGHFSWEISHTGKYYVDVNVINHGTQRIVFDVINGNNNGDVIVTSHPTPIGGGTGVPTPVVTYTPIVAPTSGDALTSVKTVPVDPYANQCISCDFGEFVGTPVANFLKHVGKAFWNVFMG